jgi:23S rRNA (uracil1939-C5)-methyltransferase
MTAETREVDIVRLGARGDGVAETSAGPVFVAGALPGERVCAGVEGNRGHIVEVLRASPERIAPICPHFGMCGGCAAQHMSEVVYRDWKRSMVVEAFRHRGLDPEIADVVLTGTHSRRRAVLTARRIGGEVLLGYHAEGAHDLVNIAQCPVLVADIEQALPALREIATLALGLAKDARLTVLATDAGLDVDVAGAPPMSQPDQRSELARLASANRVARLMVGGEPVMLNQAPVIEIGGTRVSLPPGGFVQASASAEAAMREITLGAVGKARRVADLFCGAGTFTFALARKADVLAVDGDAVLIGALTQAARHTSGLRPVTARVRDLFREPLSRKELDGFDAVVIDPPRAGAKAQTEAIARSKIGVVVAVSCNPATLARDARILVDGGYAIERVMPIDQFVFAAHVEAVAVLRKRTKQ